MLHISSIGNWALVRHLSLWAVASSMQNGAEIYTKIFL